MPLRRRILTKFAVLPIAALTCAAAPAWAQAPRPVGFLADHYDISAALDSTHQSINAIAKVDFRATEASSNVRVELHPNLIVSEVKTADGKSLGFGRDSTESPLCSRHAAYSSCSRWPCHADVHLLRPSRQRREQPDTRCACRRYQSQTTPTCCFLRRWFPLTNYPSNRYTATFRLNVPDNFAVAGIGKGFCANASGGKECRSRAAAFSTLSSARRPAPHGTFVAGNLQLNPKQAEGINVAVYAPRSDSANAQGFADDVARAVTVFSDLFGRLPDPDFTVIQLPDGTVRDFAAPGVLLLSRRLWEPKTADRTIARLVASQWWGDSSPSGLARRCLDERTASHATREALYAEQNAGKEAGLRAVDEFAVGALMYDDAAPVGAGSPARSVFAAITAPWCMNKGAMIFHMLRGQMGDVAFKTLLHDFYYRSTRSKTRTHRGLLKLAQTKHVQAAAKPGEAAPNLRGFFAQWLNSTGVPDFTTELCRLPHAQRLPRRRQDQAAARHLPHARRAAHRHGRQSGNENRRCDRHRIALSPWKPLDGPNPAASRSIPITSSSRAAHRCVRVPPSPAARNSPSRAATTTPLANTSARCRFSRTAPSPISAWAKPSSTRRIIRRRQRLPRVLANRSRAV